jgi:hypothetical protein
MQFLRKTTAATITVGPVLDVAGLPVTNAVLSDFHINKDGTSSTLVSPTSVSHSHNGHYFLSLDSSDLDEEGRVEVTSSNSNHAMPPARFQVVSQTVYDLLYKINAVGPPTVGDIRIELSPELAFMDAPMSSKCSEEATAEPINDVCGTTLRSFYKEEKIFSLSVSDVNGDPYDFSGLTLIICIERQNGTNLQVIEDGDIVRSLGAVAFTTELANDFVGQHSWSLRRTDTNEVILWGDYIVRKAALS